MTLPTAQPIPSIVVGIDGSKAAVMTAEWAIDEAASRGAPLRLVQVIGDGEHDGPEREYAEEALRSATAAVHGYDRPVAVQTAIHCGDVDTALLCESQSAAMICVGTVGIGQLAARVLGSTAVALATRAQCPVAIIRRGGRPSHDHLIVVIIDDRPDNEHVVQAAMDEARLRRASVLGLGVSSWNLGSMSQDRLDQRMETWRQRYPDVHLQLCEAPGGAVEYLDTRNQPVALLVTGSINSRQLTRLVGPHNHPILDHPACSVLVIRH